MSSPALTKPLWIIDLAGILVCAAVAMAAYSLMFRPLLTQRVASRETAQQLERQCEEADKRNASLLSLKKNTIVAREELAASDVHLESVDTINHQIADLTGLLTDCQLTLEDIQTGRIVMGRRFDLVPIRVSGKGGYDQFMVFLHKLRVDLPDISVAGLDMQGTPERPSETGQFIFDLFWFAAPSIG